MKNYKKYYGCTSNQYREFTKIQHSVMYDNVGKLMNKNKIFEDFVFKISNLN